MASVNARQHWAVQRSTTLVSLESRNMTIPSCSLISQPSPLAQRLALRRAVTGLTCACAADSD